VTYAEDDRHRPVHYAEPGQCHEPPVERQALWLEQPDSPEAARQPDRQAVLLEHAVGGSAARMSLRVMAYLVASSTGPTNTPAG